MKLVAGRGTNDFEGKIYTVDENGKKKAIKSYSVWSNMLNRCYNKNTQKSKETYVDATVHEKWFSFTKFKTWYDENYPKELAEKTGITFELDKDLLREDGKVYSEKTCIFLPKEVNLFIAKSRKTNKTGQTGVSFDKRINKYQVQINDFETKKQKHVATVATLEEAKKIYEIAREEECVKVRKFLKELGYATDVIYLIR